MGLAGRAFGERRGSKVLGAHAETAAVARGTAAQAFAVLRQLVADADAQWSAGAFGAIAEFLREPQEAAEISLSDTRIAAATARGAIAVSAHPEMTLLAYETLSRAQGLWRHSIAICLPEAVCAMHRRGAVTELGPDRDAVRPQDRSGILFDLGLGLLQTDACIRTSDPELLQALRASEGKGLFEAQNPVLMDILRASPLRVFVTRLARVEVFQPIPPPDGKSPLGPHTHILPKLLRAHRTHAATTPVPVGLVPCANVYPAHALLDGEGMPRPFDQARLEAFDALLTAFGRPALVAVQREMLRLVAAGAPPQHLQVPDKFARASVRVALRKLRASGHASAALSAWCQHFDRASADDGDEETQHA